MRSLAALYTFDFHQHDGNEYLIPAFLRIPLFMWKRSCTEGKHLTRCRHPLTPVTQGFDCTVTDSSGARKLNKCTAKPGAISLNLEGRGLDSVAAGAFDGVIVSLIDLSNNALTDLPDGVFAKVQEVCTPRGG